MTIDDFLKKEEILTSAIPLSPVLLSLALKCMDTGTQVSNALNTFSQYHGPLPIPTFDGFVALHKLIQKVLGMLFLEIPFQYVLNVRWCFSCTAKKLNCFFWFPFLFAHWILPYYRSIGFLLTILSTLLWSCCWLLVSESASAFVIDFHTAKSGKNGQTYYLFQPFEDLRSLGLNFVAIHEMGDWICGLFMKWLFDFVGDSCNGWLVLCVIHEMGDWFCVWFIKMGAVNNGQYEEAIRIQQHFGNMVLTRHFSSSSKRTIGKKFCF